MSFGEKGFFFHEEGRLSCLVLCDENTGMMETIYRPTESDLISACVRYVLDWPELKHILQIKDPACHTMFIEIHQFRQYCMEVQDGVNRGRGGCD